MHVTRWLAAIVASGALMAACGGSGELRYANRSTEDLTRMAERGNTDAQFALAMRLKADDPASFEKREPYLREAADDGHVAAMREYAWVMSRKGELAADIHAAVKWWEDAAAKGDTTAMVALGGLYVLSASIERDVDRALELLEKARKAGNTDAMLELAWIYRVGVVVPKDEKRAFRMAKQAADQDDPTGMVALAGMYLDGIGVDADRKRALRLTRRAAKLDEAEALRLLTYFQEQGADVSDEEVEAAVERLMALREDGDVEASYALSTLYLVGSGVPRDESRANRANFVAVVGGHREGIARRAARGFEQVRKRSRRYYNDPLYGFGPVYRDARVAADLGSPSAMTTLGAMYFDGYGVRKDVEEAERLWTIAAAYGDTAAIENLKLVGGTGSRRCREMTKPCDWPPAGAWQAQYWCYTDFADPGINKPTYCRSQGGGVRKREGLFDRCNDVEGWCRG